MVGRSGYFVGYIVIIMLVVLIIAMNSSSVASDQEVCLQQYMDELEVCDTSIENQITSSFQTEDNCLEFCNNQPKGDFDLCIDSCFAVSADSLDVNWENLVACFCGAEINAFECVDEIPPTIEECTANWPE